MYCIVEYDRKTIDRKFLIDILTSHFEAGNMGMNQKKSKNSLEERRKKAERDYLKKLEDAISGKSGSDLYKVDEKKQRRQRQIDQLHKQSGNGGSPQAHQ